MGLPTHLEFRGTHQLYEESAVAVFGNVYEPLVDVDAALRLKPGLAETWYTPDELTWIFVLRPRLVLHDGRELSAAQVAGALDRTRTNPASLLRGLLKEVATVQATDARTLVVKTNRPFGPLAYRLSQVRLSIDAARAGDPPVGTGPYRLLSWPTPSAARLVAFAGYRNGPPSMPWVEFRSVPDSRRRHEMVTSGELDIASDVDPEDLVLARGGQDIRTAARDGIRVLFLGLDCHSEVSRYVYPPGNPFRDRRVRRAVSLAIDRGALVRDALHGQGRTAAQLLPSETLGGEQLPPIAFDPVNARRMLSEAGAPASFQVTLDFSQNRHPGVSRIATAIARDLGRIGIKVTLRPEDDVMPRLAAQDTSMFLTRGLMSTSDAGLFYEYFVHSRILDFGRTNGGGYSDRELDGWLDDAAHELRLRRRWQLYRRVAERIHSEAPIIPLVVLKDVYVTRPTLLFRPRLDRQIRAEEISWQ